MEAIGLVTPTSRINCGNHRRSWISLLWILTVDANYVVSDILVKPYFAPSPKINSASALYFDIQMLFSVLVDFGHYVNTLFNSSGAEARFHDDVIKWKHFPRYWPFVRGVNRSPMDSPHKGQRRGALIFSLLCVWTNGRANNGDAGDLRRHCAHYEVTVMLGVQLSQYHLGAVSIRKTVLPGMVIPMLKIRRPNGRLIFNMGIPIPGKDGLYIETGPCCCWLGSLQRQTISINDIDYVEWGFSCIPWK